MSLLIRGARVLDPASGLDGIAEVGIRNGLIDHLGSGAPAGAYEETLDAAGLWLLPGLLDLAARFREPGQSHKASFRSEVPAAFASGITGIVLPPDTSPAIDSPAIVNRIHRSASAAGPLNVHVLGALTKGLAGEALSEMGSLKQAGCVGLGNAYAPLANSLIARRALEYANGLGLTVHVFAQDASLANGGCVHEGPVGTRLGLSPIPAAAEVAALRFWVSLVEDTGASIHVGRLSTSKGAGLVESAQRRGLPVTADVAVHQLFLTDEDVDGFNAQCHVIPPLRSAEDRDGLREAVRRGVIGTICSDHQPHEIDAKTNPFPQTEPGISGLESLLPLALRFAAETGMAPLDLVARLSSGPAAVIDAEAGSLALGRPADLLLVDSQARWRLQASALRSAGRNTAFDGSEMHGRVVRTLVRGQTVFSA
ncbi:dihydroorotase family protein [Solimonas sp. SE-A11]|uniref:dihydroorotase n=1 Tax=Solimonas sp. SE-A11 TaxID=3054954 RepID=UPI00259D0D1B|nr:dihydroorotase [Solimonas sp. SE-A11]MDM4769396.1 dihydroorotase [Solimonas sp. SE-A11]